MTIKVMTAEHGEYISPDANWWETSEGNEGWINEGYLWVAKHEGAPEAVAEFAKGAWLFVTYTEDPEPAPAKALPLTAEHRDRKWVDGDGYVFTHLAGNRWLATKDCFSHEYHEPVGQQYWGEFTEVVE